MATARAGGRGKVIGASVRITRCSAAPRGGVRFAIALRQRVRQVEQFLHGREDRRGSCCVLSTTPLLRRER